MNFPPGILAAALLFWGVQAGFLWIAIALGLILEFARWSPWHCDFSDADFNRVWDVTAVLFLGAALYCYNNNERLRSGYLFFQYFPLIFLPMAASQLFSRTTALRSSTFSWFLRRYGLASRDERWVDFRQVYFALCLLAASATNGSGFFFFAGFCALLSWGLWPERSPRIPIWLWSAALLGVVAAGNYGHHKLHDWQSLVEAKTSEWLSRFAHRDFDPRESRTRLGQVGFRKLSGKIVLHLESLNRRQRIPELLRQASYDAFSETTWYAARKLYRSVPFDSETAAWILNPATNSPTDEVRISGMLPNGEGLLPLPNGCLRLQNLPAAELRQSSLGAVQVRNGPGFMDYHVHLAGAFDHDDRPDPAIDLRLPDPERPLILEIANRLGLRNHVPDEAQRRIAAFFGDHFAYATYVPENRWDRTGERTALEQFLSATHRGHCEYFATATVLLLRAAGIPARYATGYAVVPSSKQGNLYLIRERHAHAWALVYRNGRWQDFDTTPASWDGLEEAQAPAWEPLRDLWSAFWFRFSAWRWGSEKGWFGRYGPLLLLPLCLALMVRLFYQRRRSRKELAAPRPLPVSRPGLDSEFYRILDFLSAHGLPRDRGETISAWFDRQDKLPALQSCVEVARKLLPLHYRYRFDPKGIAAGERAELARASQAMEGIGSDALSHAG